MQLLLSDVRVTYSGLVGLAVSIIGLLSSTLFIIIVTRQLTPEDFGLWTLIGPLLVYVVFVEPVISFWTTRQIARGEEVGKTALFSSGLFSLGGIFAYSMIIIFVSASLNVDLNVLLLSSVMVPLLFVNHSLTAICGGFKPQASSYGVLMFQISKVPIGFLFVYFMELGIEGAIITVILAELIRFVVVIIMAREKIIGKVKSKVIKFWLGKSWLTLYQNASALLLNFDVLVFSLITGSLSGLAFWGAAKAVSSRIGQLGILSQGLYPKLLAKGKKEFAEENLKILMYFAIPFLGGAILFSKPILYVLNPLYVEAVYVVIILSIRSILVLFTKVTFRIMLGYEQVDLDIHASFKQYIKSKLFFLSTLSYISTASYIILLVIFLMVSSNSIENDIDKVTIWSFIYLAISIPFVIYGFYKIKQDHEIRFPLKSTVNFSGVTLLSSVIVFLIAEKTLTYSQSIFDFLPQLIPLIVLGGAIYFGLTYIIDGYAKKLLDSIFTKILKK